MHNRPFSLNCSKLASFQSVVKAPCGVLAILHYFLVALTAVAGFQSANAQTSLGTPENFEFHTEALQLNATSLRFDSPLVLKTRSASLYTSGGSLIKTKACARLVKLKSIAVQYRGRYWLTVDELNGCQSDQMFRLNQPRLTMGSLRLRASLAKLQASTQLTAQNASADCGNFLPLSMRSEAVELSDEGLHLESVKMGLGPVPVAWFPELSLRSAGSAGLLFPRLAVTQSNLAIGLPFYAPIDPYQYLLVEPGYQHRRRRTHEGFGRMEYRWVNHGAQLGYLTITGQPRSAALSMLGDGHSGNLMSHARGNTWWAARDDLPPQTLTLRNRIGFGHAVSGLLWSRRGTRVKAEAARTIEAGSDEDKFSQLHIHFAKSLPLQHLALSLQHDSWAEAEPAQRWLGQTGLLLSLNESWIWARLDAESKLALVQMAEHRSATDDRPKVQAQGAVWQSMSLNSDWVRPWRTIAHELHLSLGGSAHYRQNDLVSELDPDYGFGSSSIRTFGQFGTGLRRSNQFFRIRFRQVAAMLSPQLPDTFTQLTTTLNHQSILMHGSFVPKKQRFLNARLRLNLALSVETTFLQQKVPILMDRMWVDESKEGAPTLHHGLSWQGRYQVVRADLWYIPGHKSVSAASMKWGFGPRCECVKVTTDVQYQEQQNELLVMLQVQLNIESNQRPTL